MGFKSEVVKLLSSHITELTTDDILDSIEVPKHTSMGDFAFPCFKLSKVFRKAPNMISVEIVEKLDENDSFEKIEAVGPYVNFTINKSLYAKNVIEKVVKLNDDYGKQTIGEKKTVIVEYSSVNIAKIMHVGH